MGLHYGRFLNGKSAKAGWKCGYAFDKISDSLLFDYTFGGEKIRKLQTSPVARDRIYLGGAEFVNDTLELYHHAEGRVVLSGVKPTFQYRIADHLGNTVVFFEDRDGDTKIKTESMTSDPDSLEVLQRNYYYPFGMEMEGPWQAATAPRADYLYNGKELEEDLDLNWYAYGFRYYDPSIGRFTGVDPIAAEFAWVSVYNYAENEPVGHIDLWGLQKYTPKMQSIDKPSDLVSTKMLNNLWEGTKTAAIEVGDIFNRFGNWIESKMPEGGIPDPSDYEDENYTHKGSGVETFSDTPVSGSGTQALPNAEEGATVAIGSGEIIIPADGGGILGNAAANSTNASRLLYFGGLVVDKASEISDTPVKPVDSLCNSCPRPPHGELPYRRIDANGNPIDTIKPNKTNDE
jgi:RHS repeat-associated protein